MRADRLLSIVFYLQSNKRMTAQDLSRELGVTERTIYRDMVALNSAGIPVYSMKGPKGGFSLIDDFKTTFTGLTEEDLNALSMLDISPQLVQLGLDQKVKLALLKLSAALPASRTTTLNLINQKIFFDPDLWFQTTTPPPHLQTIHKALRGDQKLKLIYKLPFEVTREWVVEPYGLVSKSYEWHLVCRKGKSGLNVLAVSRVVEAQILEETFTRKDHFNLEEFWKKWCAEYELKRRSYIVSLRIKRILLMDLGRNMSIKTICQDESNAGNEWLWVEVRFGSLEDARENIIGYGNSIEVIEPEALRLSIQDYAEQIANVYKPDLN